jgi:hypothetical protein
MGNDDCRLNDTAILRRLHTYRGIRKPREPGSLPQDLKRPEMRQKALKTAASARLVHATLRALFRLSEFCKNGQRLSLQNHFF